MTSKNKGIIDLGDLANQSGSTDDLARAFEEALKVVNSTTPRDHDDGAPSESGSPTDNDSDSAAASDAPEKSSVGSTNETTPNLPIFVEVSTDDGAGPPETQGSDAIAAFDAALSEHSAGRAADPDHSNAGMDAHPVAETPAEAHSAPKKKSPAGIRGMPTDSLPPARPRPVVATEPSEREKDLQNKLAVIKQDFENFRKRNKREFESLIKRAGEDMILQLLPVIDSFDRALAGLPESAQTSGLGAGLKLIHRQLSDVLLRNGVVEIQTAEVDFDPMVHYAVEIRSEPGRLPNKVIAVPQKGYMLNDKMIRPAMVVVSGPTLEVPAATNQEQEEGEEVSIDAGLDAADQGNTTEIEIEDLS